MFCGFSSNTNGDWTGVREYWLINFQRKNGTASFVKSDVQEAGKWPWKRTANSALLSSMQAMKLPTPREILQQSEDFCSQNVVCIGHILRDEFSKPMYRKLQKKTIVDSLPLKGRGDIPIAPKPGVQALVSKKLIDSLNFAFPAALIQATCMHKWCSMHKVLHWVCNIRFVYKSRIFNCLPLVLCSGQL